jgi:predicted nuclease of restriction endonuclease-like (RecB) superfamily
MEKSKNITILDKDYLQWIKDLSSRYRRSQIKAAVKVNEEMLRFYWELGRDITERQYDNKYGVHFYENLSRDLYAELGVKKGLSPTSLKYTKYFYQLYSPLIENHQQVEDDFQEPNRPQAVDEIGITNRPQLVDDLELLFKIPWGHHRFIIDKVKGDARKGLFFVRKTLENNWGRGILENFLSTDLYKRQGAALTNFSSTMPLPESELAQAYFKDPYRFEFAELNEEYTEKELKDELMSKLTRFLLELGKGFSFVGREYRLSAGGKDKFVDLLFYIIPLHRYCVIEVKITEFDFPDIGQLAGYTAMVDDLMNTPAESPSIGLLICKEKNTVMARYALSRISTPIGISEYELAHQSLPKDLQDSLPTTEEIERQLERSMKDDFQQ